jgi:osmoprotectant transport system substrate-binding protein
MKKNNIRAIFALILLSAISLFSSASERLVVGGKGFTENLLIAEITSQYLTSKGYDITTKTGLGTAVIRKALINGQLDLYWEYTGPTLVNYHKRPGVPREEMLDLLNELDAKNGLKWLESSDVNDTYAFAMNRDTAAELGIKNMDDLAAKINSGENIRLASNAEFYGRADGLKPLQEAYNFEFPRKNISRMDSGLTYSALKQRDVEVALVFSTDGRIPAFDFIIVEDNKDYHVPQVMTPVVRQTVLNKNPELKELMHDISSKLDDDIMANLNSKVAVDKQTLQQVAKEFLSKNKLI